MFDMVLNTPPLNIQESLANFCEAGCLLKSENDEKMDNDFIYIL